MPDKGQSKEIVKNHTRTTSTNNEDFVLEKSIFSNVFEKDIRRVYIYKKVERLAKAIHLISPAFPTASSLRNKFDAIALALVDAAIEPPGRAREALSRELLALSSVLGIARIGGLLSSMNADLIVREVHSLLQEIAEYEEPRLFLEDTPTLATLSKSAEKNSSLRTTKAVSGKSPSRNSLDKGHIKDTTSDSKRQESILSVISQKGTVYIKDISTVMREVSEKTIQRELQKMVAVGTLQKTGSRRWTSYTLS